MKCFHLVQRRLLFVLLLMNVVLLITGCGKTAVEKTTDPAQVEEERKAYEEMSKKERAS